MLGERNDTIKHECPVLRHQIDIGLQHFRSFRVGDQRAVFFQEIVDLGGRFLESGFKGVERGRVGIDQMGIDQYPQFHVSLACLTQRFDAGQAIFLDLLDAIGLLVGDEKPDGSDQQQPTIEMITMRVMRLLIVIFPIRSLLKHAGCCQ